MTATVHDLRAELDDAMSIRTELPWRRVDPTVWPSDRAVQARARVATYQISVWRVADSPSWDWLVWGHGGVAAASDTTREYTAAGALYAAGQSLQACQRAAREVHASVTRGRAA